MVFFSSSVYIPKSAMKSLYNVASPLFTATANKTENPSKDAPQKAENCANYAKLQDWSG